MWPSGQPTVVGAHLGRRRCDAFVWDGRCLTPAFQEHDDSNEASIRSLRECWSRLNPSRPNNIILATSRTDLRPSTLEAFANAAHPLGTISARVFRADGTQCELDDSCRDVNEPSGAASGVLGALACARQAGYSSVVVVEQNGGDVVAVRSRSLASRPVDDAWLRSPIEAGVEAWLDPPLRRHDVAGESVIAIGAHAGAAADHARALGASLVIHPQHADQFRALGLLLVDPVLDVTCDMPKTPHDDPERRLRHLFSELMEQAARTAQDAGYEQDDFEFYRYADIQQSASTRERWNLESTEGLRRLASLTIVEPAASVRLGLRTLIAVHKPTASELFGQRGT